MKTTRITLTALGVLALAACGGTGAGSGGAESASADPGDLHGNTYVIASVEGEAKAEKLMSDSELSLEFDQDGRINVHTDCNQLSGEVGFDGDTMKVDRLAGTLMGCEGAATDQEKWANDLVTAKPEWQLDVDTLYLTTDSVTAAFTEKN